MRALPFFFALVLLAPSWSGAGEKDEIEIVGFSEDGSLFAYWTWGVEDGSGLPHAELDVYSTVSGKRLADASSELRLSESGAPIAALERLQAREKEALSALKLGRDRGVELYRAGTARTTRFTVEGVPCTLRLVVVWSTVNKNTRARKERIRLELETPRAKRTVFSGGEGFDYSLNSVRISADRKALAVVVKYSSQGFEGPNRRFLLVPVRL